MTRTLALLALLLLPAVASAADLAPPLAAGSYWKQFTDYWLGRFKEQSGMVLAVLAVGAVGIGIIVCGNKWKK
jgi:hypothetical protein